MRKTIKKDFKLAYLQMGIFVPKDQLEDLVGKCLFAKYLGDFIEDEYFVDHDLDYLVSFKRCFSLCIRSEYICMA